MSWQPSATLNSLKHRAKAIQNIRQFFISRGYLEVETPCLSEYGVTDVHLSNIQANFRSKFYSLQTSPEYPMKRLLAYGSGPIFQIARVFRDDELGRWHNPEFTMLEWYQLDIDHHSLLKEVDELLQLILGCPPLVKKTYAEVFKETCDIDPFSASLKELQGKLVEFSLGNVLDKDEKDRDLYLYLLMSHVVEPALANFKIPVAVYDFPASQAALAKISNDNRAERFEVYYRGIELANGFHELIDGQAQRQRFRKDLEKRLEKNLAQPQIDERFLKALEHGLPACSGVALGIDRLVALALDKKSLSEVLAFDFSRA